MLSCRVPAPADLLIRGATVVDGGGRPGYTADVLIARGRIVRVEPSPGALAARRVIDADGLVAAPGFVDIHSHSDYHLLVAPQAESSIRQGVTLEVGGNCGYAPAPLWGTWQADRAAEYRAAYGLACPGGTLEAYFAALESARPAINYGQLIGHNTLRGSATGGAARPVRPDELAAMLDAARAAMRAGALGLSTGLAYPPACYGDAAELIALARVVREEGGLLAAHVRSEGDGLLEALDEILGVARAAGVPLQISHLKTMHERNWDKLDAALGLIEAARAAGMDVTADRYPYTAANTGLDAILPGWAVAGTREERRARLTDPALRPGLLAALAARPAATWERIVIAEVADARHRRDQGRTVAEAAAAAGARPEAFVLDLLADGGGPVGAIFHAMSPGNLERILTRTWVMIGSDSACRTAGDALGAGIPHPRTFGTFARAVGPLVRESKLFTLETAVRKATGDPCRRLGLRDRGRLAPGFHADVVLFDPARVRDMATYEQPWRFAEGVHWVLVNGQPAVEAGALTGARPGRIVRRPGALAARRVPRRRGAPVGTPRST
jgi:N-acyl-D-amino-acid deacylase